MPFLLQRPAAPQAGGHARAPRRAAHYGGAPAALSRVKTAIRRQDGLADLRQAATDLARIVAALQRIDPAGGPPPGEHNSGRGAPLAERDPAVHAAIASLDDVLDSEAVTAAWEAALRAPAWRGPPVWIHGDLSPGNLLVLDGRLSAVIDFGCLGVGDPACDLLVAWTLLSGESRDQFRAALSVDDATWARGRGWALSFGLIALPYYQRTNPVLAGTARHAIDEALADHEDEAARPVFSDRRRQRRA